MRRLLWRVLNREPHAPISVFIRSHGCCRKDGVLGGESGYRMAVPQEGEDGPGPGVALWG